REIQPDQLRRQGKLLRAFAQYPGRARSQVEHNRPGSHARKFAHPADCLAAYRQDVEVIVEVHGPAVPIGARRFDVGQATRSISSSPWRCKACCRRSACEELTRANRMATRLRLVPMANSAMAGSA